jgi:EmrB/QacA subfamily drug resistance transporter
LSPAAPPGTAAGGAAARHDDDAPQIVSRPWLRLALIGLGAAGVPLDTAVNIGFPDITASFHQPIEMIQWVVIAYVLTYASLMLAFGRIGDIFGYARVFRAGLAWSTAAFLLCAAAPAYGWLLFFRFLQGIGAGLVISVAPALVTNLYPEHRRSRAVAAFTLMFAIASAMGPLVGGWLVRYFGWPAVFWFRAPIALAALLLLLGRLPEGARRAAREPLDIAGAALLALGISSLLLVLNALQHPGRNDYLAAVLAASALSGLYGFVRRERRALSPIIDLELFRIGGFAAINLASLVVYLTSFAVLLFAPYYLVRFAALPVPAAGAMLAASFAGTMAASPIAGRILGRIKANRLAFAGAGIGGAGLLLIAEWSPGSDWQIPVALATLVTQGFGVGLFQVAYMDVVIAAVPRDRRGVAGSLAMLTRTLGVVGGATLLTLLFHAAASWRAAGGTGTAYGFLTAYRAIFRLAGVASLLAGVMALEGADRR